MDVFFDYQVFYLQKYGGISRYFYELANELNHIHGCHPKIVAPVNYNAYLQANKDKDFILNYQPGLKKIIENRYFKKGDKVNEFITKRLIASAEKPVLHETYYTNRLKTKAATVVTIHDMIYELFPKAEGIDDQMIANKRDAVLQADAIIAVSENTKKDLLYFYPEVTSKTTVVYHGVNKINIHEVEIYPHARPFILYVGHRGSYKNFSTLLNVYCNDKKINAEFDLICIGGENVTTSELEVINKHRVVNHVHFIAGDNVLLYSLYKSAQVFVYPSRYEGFGMPVLEAMSVGCPVICANTSSLPEVAGQAAVLIDPGNRDELDKALITILYNESLRTMLAAKGLEWAAGFTWAKCAAQTFEIYRRLV